MPLFRLRNLRSLVSSKMQCNEVLLERLPLREHESLSSDLFDAATTFWFAQRREDGLPEWSSFKPEQHPKLLGNIILYERVDGPRYVTRLVGDAILDYLPINPVGQFIDDVVHSERLDDVTMRLDRTFIDELPNYVEKSNVWKHSGALFNYNALSMPFVTRTTGVKRVLCILEFNVLRLNE